MLARDTPVYGAPSWAARAMVQSAETWRYGPIIPDNPNWHRHKGWCPLYRERWGIGNEPDGAGGVLLYQIICLQNTPPETEDEQAECMKARKTCWRLQHAAREARRQKRTAAV